MIRTCKEQLLSNVQFPTAMKNITPLYFFSMGFFSDNSRLLSLCENISMIKDTIQHASLIHMYFHGSLV